MTAIGFDFIGSGAASASSPRVCGGGLDLEGSVATNASSSRTCDGERGTPVDFLLSDSFCDPFLVGLLKKEMSLTSAPEWDSSSGIGDRPRSGVMFRDTFSAGGNYKLIYRSATGTLNKFRLCM